MSKLLRALVYGDCPELEHTNLPLETSPFNDGGLRSSFKQKINGFDFAIIEAVEGDDKPLQYVRFLRQVAPSCATILIAEPAAINTIQAGIESGLHDYIIRAGEPKVMGPLLTHTIERAMRHNHIREQFHDSEKRFWTFFDSCPIGLVVLSLSGKCEQANPAFQEMLGYSLEEMREFTTTQLLADEDTPIWKPLRDELRSGQRDFVRLELRFIDKNKHLTWTKFACVAIHDSHGSPDYLLAMAINTTGEKRIQKNLQHADKMQSMGRLAGGVAHDFNNILTIINSHCFIMRDILDDTERLEWSMERIITATSRGSKLTRQLLTFGRRQARDAEPVNPNEVLDDMRVVLESLFGKTIRVDLAMGSDLRNIDADRGQLEQVIMNLALNARDAMPEGGKFTVSTFNLHVDGPSSAVPAELPQGAYTVLEVSDTGVGMPPEIQQQVFDPFFTTKEVGEGTGLGLSTVYGVITQDSGMITVDSEEDRGTTFRIYLPSSRKEAQTPAKLRRARKGTPNGGTETILLVEDEPELREPMRQLLESKGYEVMEASNAEDALQLSRSFSGSIDLLLTDVIMPGNDGVSLARIITEERSETAVILMSGYTADALAMDPDSARQHKLLQKPFGMDILSRTIRQMLKSP